MEEAQYRRGSKRIRPFAQSAGVSQRGCSRPLQRAVTDFGADSAYAQVMDKLVEHYGVMLGESTIRRITQGHAQTMFESASEAFGWPVAAGRSAVVIAEMDGGMVPIVEPDASQRDRRKGKKLHWSEAKICLAHAQGSKDLIYRGTLQGSADTAGQKLFTCATQAGFGRNTTIHAVGDGAPWIADQVEDRFGAQGSYLLDFYHVCDYLSAAAEAVVQTAVETAIETKAGAPPARTAWMDQLKHRLKTGQVGLVLQALQSRLEPAAVADSDAPVRQCHRCQCHRYLTLRPEQLDYQGALARGLPIGSGEIESAHRCVVQQRLKRPGAWWRAANAEHMLALRLLRANHGWNQYWANDLIHPLARSHTSI